MNPIVKSQLNKFKEKYTSEDLSDSEFFEVMSIFSIENGVLGENINPFDAHLRGSEFGIDGIAISIQGKLCLSVEDAEEIISLGRNHQSEFHFYQSKISENIDYGDLSKFLDAVYDFFGKNILCVSDQVSDLVSVKDKIYEASAKSSPKLKCFYCTTGVAQKSDLISDLIQKEKDKLQELCIFADITIECVGASLLVSGYRSATNSNSSKINFPKAVTLPSHEKVEEAYIGYVAASEIISIALGEKDSEGNRYINRSIFYDNVRDFDPDSEINKSIFSDLEKGDYESFVFKNNGITIVSKNIDRRGDTFTIDDYQVVNGCQTTNILIRLRDNVDKIFVPLRLIGCKDSDFVASVIIGTNKQNEVKIDQFWALSPFMKNLEEYCSSQNSELKIHIERRENQYRDVVLERTRIIRPSDLMKAVVAMYFFQPHRAARDYRGITKDFSDQIFCNNHSVELYHLAALAFYKFDFMVRNSRIDRSKAIFKFYAMYYLVRKFWDKTDLLNSPPKSQNKTKDKILNILISDEKFKDLIDETSEIIESLIESSKLESREKIRDHIRGESFLIAFTQSAFTTQPA